MSSLSFRLSSTIIAYKVSAVKKNMILDMERLFPNADGIYSIFCLTEIDFWDDSTVPIDKIGFIY